MAGVLEAQVIRETLSQREQMLLRLAGNGKSPDAISKIYREYDGPNGVEEALAEIRGKVQTALNGHAGEPRTQIARLAEDDEDDGLGGIPVRSVPAGSLNGAGAGPASPVATPPRVPAPAHSSDRPSGGELAVRNSSPAPRNTHPRARERDDEICVLLAVRQMSTKALGQTLSIRSESMKSALERLRTRGLIEHTGVYATDYKGARRGLGRSTVWKLVDEPDGVQPPLDLSSEPPSYEEFKAQTLLLLADTAMSAHDIGARVGGGTQPARRMLEEMEGEELVTHSMGSPNMWRLKQAALPAKLEIPQPATACPQKPTEADKPAGTGPPVTTTPAAVIGEDGNPHTYAEIFDAALDGLSALVTEQWMHAHAQDALLKWARNGRPMYWQDEPAMSAYLSALLKGLEQAEAGSDAYFRICDRIDRIIFGDDSD